jgi:hypothetical protein
MIDKPGKFSGVNYSVQQFNTWVLKVRQYIDLLDVPPSKRMAVAATYLDGDAAQWWARKVLKLQADRVDSTNLSVFEDQLRERFSFKNPEQAARNTLRTFQQGNLSVPEYINEFDNLYTYLPSWDETDKIDRFLAGLQAKWREKATINPTTGRRWTEYYPMVNFLVSLLHESASTGVLQEEVRQPNRQVANLCKTGLTPETPDRTPAGSQTPGGVSAAASGSAGPVLPGWVPMEIQTDARQCGMQTIKSSGGLKIR